MFTFPLQVDELYDGLILWWPFNELTGSAKDRSGNGYDATISGASQGADGQEGYSISTDGVNDDASTAAAGFFTEFNSLSEFTIAFWAAGVSFESYDACLGIADVNANEAIAIYPFHETGGMMSENVVNIWWNGTDIIQATGAPAADGNFNHYCLVSRNSTDHEVYVNGSSSGTSVVSKTIDADTEIVSAGSYDGVNEFFEGDIDDVRIYNRALSDAEISRLAAL